MTGFGWIDHAISFLTSELRSDIAKIVAAVFVVVVIWATRAVGKWLWKLIDYHRRIRRAGAAVARKTDNGVLHEGDGLWVTEPLEGANSAEFKNKIDAARILLVANAKGGVGKTTVSANVAACLAGQLDKPVLMIDLDFQGTLSSMAIAQRDQWQPPRGHDSRATHLISGDISPKDIAHVGLAAAREPNAKIITSFYDLAQAENRIMVEWLLGDRKKDVRFTLADVLLDPAVRAAYSLIVIDAPPRFTTGAIQALACSTHLLIPTVLDDPSNEAVVTFVRNVENFKKAGLCPHIKYIGVVGSIGLTHEDTELSKQRLIDRLNDSWDKNGANGVTGLLPENTFLPRSKFFRNAVASGGIAYLTMGNSQEALGVKRAIHSLVDQVKREMRL